MRKFSQIKLTSSPVIFPDTASTSAILSFKVFSVRGNDLQAENTALEYKNFEINLYSKIPNKWLVRVESSQ